MLLAARLLLLRWLAARTLGGVVGGILAVVLPAAAGLKIVGVPVLAVAGIVGAPVAGLLALIGLPLAIVVGVVGVVGALAAAAAVLGVLALKYVLPALLVGWAVSRLFRTLRRRTGEAEARRAAAVDDMPAASGPVSEAPII